MCGILIPTTKTNFQLFTHSRRMDDSSGSEGFVSADEGLEEDFVTLGQSQQPSDTSNQDNTTTEHPETQSHTDTKTSETPQIDPVPPASLEVNHPSASVEENQSKTSSPESISRESDTLADAPVKEGQEMSTTVDKSAPDVASTVGEEQRNVVPVVEDEEKAPVPPPRRKRKKKLMQKPPSLENLIDQPKPSPPMQRSMTLASAELHRDKLKARKTEQDMMTDLQDAGDLTPHVSEEALKTFPDGDDSETLSGTEKRLSDSSSLQARHRLSDHMTRVSRSATPTPAISIEPDGGLELTADFINGQENEIVTSDTRVAKSKGSADPNTGIVITSDDESIDGDGVYEEEFVDDSAPLAEEDFDGVSGGGSGEGTRELSGDDKATGEVPSQQASRSRPSSGKRSPSNEADSKRSTLSPSPSDNAILESTMIKNLDTGEMIPLSAAEEKIPRPHGWNPLSEHLLRRTNDSYGRPMSSMDEDDIGEDSQRGKTRKGLLRWKRWGKRRDRHGDIASPMLEESLSLSPEDQHTVKYKVSSHKQGQQEFDTVRLKQDLTGTHLGAVWVMEFSICGRLLATAGQDSVVRVWVLRTAYLFFHELQAQYQRLGVHSSVDSLSEKASLASGSSKSSDEDEPNSQPFLEQPLCSYYGHTADVLDLTWSKNFFLLSSSMDKTVRLWHISRKECLCCFQHVDFVTAIAFHPRDDRYFLSGSLDGKLRLWNIPDKRVALWNEIEGVGSHLITAANFCMNGNLAVVGTYDGRCIFYETEHLKYHTQIHVRSRHGKNKGRKISGVEPLPGEDKLLVTSNDSRIRLYNLKDHSLSCKYKGCLNTSSQIKATFSRDGQYIISGSEDNYIYVWKTHLDMIKLPSRRDRNDFYECFSTHSAPVTSAVFAPVPGITVDQGLKEVGEMVVAADYQGCIKVYVSGESL